MKIDVIVPLSALVPHSVGERLRSLNHAIKHFYEKQSGVEVHVYCVEQDLGDGFKFLPHIKGRCVHKIELRNPVFNKQWCTNVGFCAGYSRFVIVAESDMFCNDSYFAALVQWMCLGKHSWAMAYDRLCYTDRGQKESVMSHRRPVITASQWTIPKRGLTEGGLVVYRRAFFQKIGMANEFFRELGGMDNELAMRARHVSGEQPMFPQKVLHLWHPHVKKSSRPSRKRNIRLLGVTARKTQQVIKWLRCNQQGVVESPLCDRKEWLK